MTGLSIWSLAGTGLFAGLVGSMLGIGGGFFIVPVLTLGMHLPIKLAIGSSLAAIVANASIAAIRYTKIHFTNAKLGVLLCCTTVPGAIVGGLLSDIFTPNVLNVLFGLIQAYVAYTMVTRQDTIPQDQGYKKNDSTIAINTSKTNISIAGYYDKATATFVGYRIKRIPQGLGGSFAAGLLSSLLGIGGGIVQVPVMNIIMAVPIKATIGTSAFIMAVTTAAGALVYYHHDYIHPFIVAPLLMGVLPGALIGTILVEHITGMMLRRGFGIFLFVTAVLMFLKAANLL